MAKKNREVADETATETNGAQGTESQEQATAAPVAGPNYTLTYRRDHPGNRCSFGVAGNSGIVVFDKGLFAGVAEGGAVPTTIVVDVQLVGPKASAKTDKSEAAAAKAAERAAKAQERIDKAQERANKAKEKAEAALAKAQEKIAKATAGATPAAEPVADGETSV